jgi:hypothetical protein
MRTIVTEGGFEVGRCDDDGRLMDGHHRIAIHVRLGHKLFFWNGGMLIPILCFTHHHVKQTIRLAGQEKS